MKNQSNEVKNMSVLNNNNPTKRTICTEIALNTSLSKQEIMYSKNYKSNSVLSNDDFNYNNKYDYYSNKVYNKYKKQPTKDFTDYSTKNDKTDVGNIQLKTTDDESMAVEALRQLGGMFSHEVTSNQTVSEFTCNICNINFQTDLNLHSHNLSCRSEICQSFRCTICNFIFDSEQNYNNHKCIVSRLYCKFCYIYFTTKTELEKHIETNHNSDRPYKCHFCDLAFIRSSSLANHLKIHNYLPGRAVFSNNRKVVASDLVNTSTWTFESIYLSENQVNNECTDSLTNWNMDYTTNSLMQTEKDESINSETNVVNDVCQNVTNENNTLEKSNLDFQMPVKVEIVPYVTDIEKCLDETFPVTSLPQMEVIIGENNIKSHICSQCGMNFVREKALISHLKLHSIGWPSTYECKDCGETFSDDKLFLDHEKLCCVHETFEQKSGGLTLKKEEISKDCTKVKRSSKSQVKVGKHRCPECDKHFTTKQKMFRHLWIHRKKAFTCELCAMTFEIQTELDKHRLSKHPADSPYVCNECGKSFASRQGLWEHGRVHGGGPAGLFTCNKCNKKFASRQGFLIHRRTHTDERPYGCRFCLKAFRDGGTLRKHERIHTGYRPYVCPICTHDFNQKVVLREHVRWVHAANKAENERGMFVCQVCNISVSDREELCAHIVKHSDLMLLEAKNTKESTVQNNLKLNNNVKKQSRQFKTHNVAKPESPTFEESIESKRKQLECNLNQYNFTEIQNSVECDLCGNKFTSQKDLMIHVQIHI